MRIVVIGASGQLGADLLDAFADLRPIGLGRPDLDLADAASIQRAFAEHAPELVINAAAFHQLDRCEADPAYAMAINALAVDELARRCAAAGIPFAHVSTDYVFDGTAGAPYGERAAPNPLSVYGISKYAGELLVKRSTERAFIFRTSGLYGVRGSSNKGPTFIERMLQGAAEGKPLRVVDDITFSPSYTRHVAAAMRRIIERGAYGIYHVTNAGACTWYEFAAEIFRQAGVHADLARSVSSPPVPGAARRPRYSALAHDASLALGLPETPSWQDGIAAYLAERAALQPMRSRT